MKNFVCSECGAKNNEYGENCRKCRKRQNQKEYYKKNREKIIKEAMERHNHLKENNLCVSCGDDIGYNTTNYCNKCKNKHNERAKNYGNERRKRLDEQGICVSCGQSKQIEGSKFCEPCLIIRRERATIFQRECKL